MTAEYDSNLYETVPTSNAPVQEYDPNLYEEVAGPDASAQEYDPNLYEEVKPESYAEKEQYGKMDFVYKKNKKGELVPLKGWEKKLYGLMYGSTSSVKGMEQIGGVGEQANKTDAEIMQRLRASKGRVGTIGAEVVGNILDPVTLALPVAKAKSLWGLARWGAAGGAIGGGINYVEPGQSRAVNTAIGAAGGAILAPGIGVGINAYRALRGRPTIPIREMIDPESAKILGLADDAKPPSEPAGLLPRPKDLPEPQPYQAHAAGPAGTADQMDRALARMTPEERVQFLGEAYRAERGGIDEFRYAPSGEPMGPPKPEVAGLLPSPSKAATKGEPIYVLKTGHAGTEAQLSRRLRRMPPLEAARQAVTPKQVNDAVGRMTPEQQFLYRAEQVTKQQGGFIDLNVFREGIKNIKDSYQQYLGRPLWESIQRNPGQAAMGVAGGSIGWQSAEDDAPISEKVGRAALGAVMGYGGTRFLSKTAVGERFARGIIDNYGLTGKWDDYIAAKKLMAADRNELAAPFVEMLKSIRGLPPADRKLLYNILQGEASTPRESLNLLNERVRSQITEVGQKMVDAGLLKEDVFKRNLATYIHREYLSKMHPEGTYARKATRAMKLIGDELRPRGYEKEVPVGQVDSALRQGAKTTGKAYFTKDGKKVVRMRFQLTKAQREALGEVEDAAYAIARTGRLMTNDLSVYRFYDKLSKNGRIASDTDPGGWVKIDEGRIPNTGINKYGNLEGKYVPPEIYADLKGLKSAQEWKHNWRHYLSIVSWWKVSKTALNPTVHMNNVISNLALYDMADADWKFIPKSIGEIRHQGEMFRAAKHLGVFDVDYASQELRRSATDLLDAYREVAQAASSPLQTALNVGRKTWGKTGGKMIDFYQVEDHVMRLAVFMDRIKKGMTPEQAAAEGRRWFIDYDINAPWINALRHTATPFISYTYRSVPLIAEAATLRPWKFAKWAAAGWAVNEMGAAFGGGNEDAERKVFADRDKGHIYGMPFFPPRLVKMPFQIGGKSTYLDVTRWIPGGDVLVSEENQFIPGAPAPLQPSFGPVGSIVKAGLGYDDFRRKPLRGLGLSNLKDWEVKGKYLVKEFTPNFPGVPGAHSTTKIMDSLRGRPTPMGDVIPWWQAGLQSIGIKLKPADLERLVRRAQMDTARDMSVIRELALERLMDLRKGRISEEEYEESILELQEEALERIGKMNKKIER
jgi:hypothetical protein